MSRSATCDRCGRSALIQRNDSLPIGWMCFKRDIREPFNKAAVYELDLCDLCFVHIQQEIVMANAGLS